MKKLRTLLANVLRFLLRYELAHINNSSLKTNLIKRITDRYAAATQMPDCGVPELDGTKL